MSDYGKFYPPVKFPRPDGGSGNIVPIGNRNQPSFRTAGSQMEPLEFLLEVLRDDFLPMDLRMEAAKAAAPYRHVRLAPVQQDGQDGVKIVVTGGLPPPTQEPIVNAEMDKAS
jgi:hypothetical protein